MTDAAKPSEVMLVLSAAAGIEQDLADFLLDNHAGGFTSSSARGHGGHAQYTNLSEMVTGRQHRIEFRLHLAEAEVVTLLDTLVDSLPGADIHYYCLPVLFSGRIQIGRAHV
mgnify:CR=1 FL=1